MATRDDFVPETFVETLRRKLPRFKDLCPQHQVRLARYIWNESQHRRVHRLWDGYMSLGHKELEKDFGRGGFKRINDQVRAFEVTKNWSKKDNATRGFRLAPAVRGLKDQYLRQRRETVTRLMTMDGKAIRTPPNAIAAKGLNGITATAWRKAKVHAKIQVDLDWMKRSYSWMTRLLERLEPADLFLQADRSELEYRVEILAHLLKLANTDVAGRGYIIHRYAEASTGRLYARGISLQTVPRLIRKAALHGLYEYDIENCHYAVFSQMAGRFGVECASINSYLANKRATREALAKEVGITAEQAKHCLLALMYGARTTEWAENAIPQAIGQKAGQLYRNSRFSAIANEVADGRIAILKGWPKRRTTILNAMGKPAAIKEKAEIRLAHLIQGIEAKALRTVVDLYPDEVVLPMHDGFVATRALDTALLERRIYEATGYRLEVSGGVITIPEDLDLSKV